MDEECGTECGFKVDIADKSDRLQLELLLLRQKSMQIVLPPEVEALVQRQLTSGKYQNAIAVILAGIKLLEQQEDIYQGRLQDLQEEARIGWEASERGEVVDGSAAMAQIRANVRSRYGVSDEA
ncbi:MAG: type II toxin-antitoxin system ParD family antitoxin [Nostoc sp.]|uniref:ribbon-helix-helix domain-containing protein n=1 Tax=Nostoc sp. TaxID=1180 RepID=UPI002FFA1D6F